MEKEKAFAYKCTKFFCDNADAVVMLTATPIQTDDNDLFTIMNVLRPDIVIDQKTFGMMSRPNAYISHAVHILLLKTYTNVYMLDDSLQSHDLQFLFLPVCFCQKTTHRFLYSPQA